MKIKKFYIDINNFRYCYIKSNNNSTHLQCKQFIDHKVDEKICWDDTCDNTHTNIPGYRNYYVGRYTFRYFYFNGVLHREDGPAVIRKNLKTGEEFSNWFMDGKLLSFEERTNQIRKINLEFCLDK